MSRAGASTIKKSALERGTMKTLRMDGIGKVLRGRTTIDEVLRITQLDTI
jgi:type II secretory ATPase GspE/PulE/Tfp pilus assembly ATPase PilB-like protein